MHNSNIPENTELPSSAKLIKSTIIAVVVAGVILVTLVLPAEFGIDPTGVGKLTGLQRMGEIKSALAEEAKADEEARLLALGTGESTPIVDAEGESSSQTHEMSVTLEPGESTEIKLTMHKGDAVEFEWATDANDAFYDLHADSSAVSYHVYEKGSSSSMTGTLTAAFDGNHGWYWKNKSEVSMTITLSTAGTYQDIKEMN